MRLWTSDRSRLLEAPAADAPASQHIAWCALNALSLACHIANVDEGEAYRNALWAYEREYDDAAMATDPTTDEGA